MNKWMTTSTGVHTVRGSSDHIAQLTLPSKNDTNYLSCENEGSRSIMTLGKELIGDLTLNATGKRW
jgi:hypothetical protein